MLNEAIVPGLVALLAAAVPRVIRVDRTLSGPQTLARLPSINRAVRDASHRRTGTELNFW